MKQVIAPSSTVHIFDSVTLIERPTYSSKDDIFIFIQYSASFTIEDSCTFYFKTIEAKIYYLFFIKHLFNINDFHNETPLIYTIKYLFVMKIFISLGNIIFNIIVLICNSLISK